MKQNLSLFKKMLCRHDIQKMLKILDGMLRVKAGRGGITWLLKAGIVIRGSNTSAVARLAVVYIRRLYTIYRHEGVQGVVIKTKAWYVLTMQAVGGMRIPSAQQLGCAVARTSSGLPRVIPSQSRKRIMQGDRRHLRLGVTWFSIYRVLVIPGKLKLSTITARGVTGSDSFDKEMDKLIPAYCKFLGYKEVGSAKSDLPPVLYMPLTKSTPSLFGPGQKISGSPAGILHGAVSLLNNKVYEPFVRLSKVIDPGYPRGGLRRYTLVELLQMVIDSGPRLSQFRPLLGALRYKVEAAGKVRVFAMVECGTQWLLGPLHSFIFKLLEKLPTDGTMDQLRPIDRLLELGFTKFWSFDLSAATDRLPVSVQVRILNHLFGDGFGDDWRSLLVDRDYEVPIPPKGVEVPRGLIHNINTHGVYVRYAVGQPMGALSSGAMLALTHHFIVQGAAHRVGYTMGSFKAYAVLGDDIVIADGKVAGAYRQLMDTLGVEIGLAKSLVSRKGVLEFAKRFIVQGQDCSPVPFKEMVAALASFEQSTEFIRKYGLGAASIAAFVGGGYRVRGRLSAVFDKLPRRLSTIGKWRCSPWGTLGHNVRSGLNIKSFVVRPEGIVQDTEMGPDLPDKVSKRFIDWASKDEQKLKVKKADLPTRGIYTGSRTLTDGMENGLYNVSKQFTTVCEFTDDLYNLYFHIQLRQGEVQLPRTKEDFSEALDVLFRMRTARVPLDQSKFLAGVESFKLQGNLVVGRKLGEVAKRRVTPSVMLTTRLGDWSRKTKG